MTIAYKDIKGRMLLALSVLAILATMGATQAARADNHRRYYEPRGVVRERMAWREHEQQAWRWHHRRPVPQPMVVYEQPDVIYAPPPVVYAPPPMSSGLTLVLPLNFR